ncbi:MAG: hypothetical protein BWY07_02015 [Candidatus Hydrogenedentes bacterium ADurb.Bin170]|nr:MAG: hypothetical protein BWY07_02015 [Candidatus Hydrogenedentes bacterium ADurb.Bin170]
MGSTPKCSDLKHKISQPEELPFSVGTPVRTAITVLVAAPEFLRHSRTPRHACEGRNLNPDMDALRCTSP